MIDYLGNGAVGAGTYILESVSHHTVRRREGIVRSFQHGHVIFTVAYADEDLPAQPLLKLPGGALFGGRPEGG